MGGACFHTAEADSSALIMMSYDSFMNCLLHELKPLINHGCRVRVAIIHLF